MNWNRTDANWSELKRKPKKQPESGKDYNINMHKSDLKPQVIRIIKPDGFNLKTNADQSLSSFNKPNVKQGA